VRSRNFRLLLACDVISASVMVAANALQALAQAASAVLLLAGHARVGELAILAAARGIGTGFYLPASEGLLPHTVPADQRYGTSAVLAAQGVGAILVVLLTAAVLLVPEVRNMQRRAVRRGRPEEVR